MVPAVIAVLAGMCAFVVVVRVCGYRHMWPWRAATLRVGPVMHDRRTASRADETPPVSSGRARQTGRPQRPQDRREQALIQKSIPVTADLLVVAVSAGHSIHSAIEVVSMIDSGPTGEALARAWQRFIGGSTLAAELRALPGLVGEEVRPLCNTLTSAISSGAPIEPALVRLADSERLRQRRRTEERIRRLPVLMLGPLVTLLLPSFMLLSIAPVLLTALRTSGL